MFKEEMMLRDSLTKMNNIFKNQYQELKPLLIGCVEAIPFPNEDDYSLVAVVKENARRLNRILNGLDVAKDYLKMMETYLDVLVCLKACEIRKLNDQEMRECQAILARNQHAFLTPRQKDLSYIGCTLENIIKSKTLEDYRKYKKFYCDLLGL